VLLCAGDVFQPRHTTIISAQGTRVRDLYHLPYKALCVRRAVSWVACTASLLFALTALGVSQTPAQSAAVPKYDLHAELKTKGIVDEINLVSVGSRKDFRELVIKSGEDRIHIYVCPQTFEQEMGITFSKGDEIELTGSKVKEEATDVILVRELVKGTDTLVFRDGKGNPVWDPRTGK
jgi:hypothetical protein